MHLLLINPSNPLVGVRKTWSGRVNRHRVWKPLSLMTLAAMTGPNWNVSIIDENLGVPDYAALTQPDLVGITAFTAQAHRAYQIAQQFRARGVPVVLGGIHATMRSEEAAARVDAVVSGEAEGVWADVLNDARHDNLKPRYNGGLTPSAQISPARHDILSKRYAFGAIQTARGCPMNCHFCSVPVLNGTQYRQRPIPSVLNELRSIPEKRVLVVDDNLIGTRPEHLERAKDLFRTMVRANIRKEWIAYVTVNFADDEELLALAAQAGCRAVGIGLETFSAKGLREIGKNFNVRTGKEFRSAIRRIQRHKILVVGAFMIGLDSDQPGIGKRIADAARLYGVDILNVCILTPLPGTRLWEQMAKEDRITMNAFPEDWKYYTLTFPVARHPHLSDNAIIDEVMSCDRSFYSIPGMLRRSLDNFRRGRQPLTNLVVNLSFRRNLRQHYNNVYADFKKRKRKNAPTHELSAIDSRFDAS